MTERGHNIGSLTGTGDSDIAGSEWGLGTGGWNAAARKKHWPAEDPPHTPRGPGR